MSDALEHTKHKVDAAAVVEDEDIDDIIGRAAELAQTEERKLTVDDVVKIGEELGLDQEHVERAIGELQAREEREKLAAVRRRRQLKIGGAIAGGVLALFLVIGFFGHRSLGRLENEAAKRRAQVRTVVERQQATIERYANQPMSRDKDAELAGAQNRVSIERRRYDEAATEYNDKAGSFPSSMWASIFGHPGRLPLSNEIDSW